METITLPTDEIRVRAWHDDRADVADLVASIPRVGLLNPPTVDREHYLIAGERRLRAVIQLGHPTVDVRVIDSLDQLLLLRVTADENECRKQLAPSRAVEILRQLADLEEKRAASAKVGTPGGGGASKRGGNRSAPSPPVSRSAGRPSGAGVARRAAARITGYSETTLRKAEAVVRAVERQPDLFGDVAAEMDATGKVDPAYQAVTAPAVPTPAAIRKQLAAVAADLKAFAKTEDGAAYLCDDALKFLRAADRTLLKPAAVIDQQVAAILGIYPRRKGGPTARNAVRKAIAAVGFKELQAHVARYAAAVAGAELARLPHPGTWFNDERWEDGEEEWRAACGLEDAKPARGPKTISGGLQAVLMAGRQAG